MPIQILLYTEYNIYIYIRYTDSIKHKTEFVYVPGNVWLRFIYFQFHNVFTTEEKNISFFLMKKKDVQLI